MRIVPPQVGSWVCCGLLGSFNFDNTSRQVLINWLFPSRRDMHFDRDGKKGGKTQTRLGPSEALGETVIPGITAMAQRVPMLDTLSQLNWFPSRQKRAVSCDPQG